MCERNTVTFTVYGANIYLSRFTENLESIKFMKVWMLYARYISTLTIDDLGDIDTVDR